MEIPHKTEPDLALIHARVTFAAKKAKQGPQVQKRGLEEEQWNEQSDGNALPYRSPCSSMERPLGAKCHPRSPHGMLMQMDPSFTTEVSLCMCIQRTRPGDFSRQAVAPSNAGALNRPLRLAGALKGMSQPPHSWSGWRTLASAKRSGRYDLRFWRFFISFCVHSK